jgi:hypothetical protein
MQLDLAVNIWDYHRFLSGQPVEMGLRGNAGIIIVRVSPAEVIVEPQIRGTVRLRSPIEP